MDLQQNSQNKENIPRGCLKLNDKIFPLFEGLNTIGRHPEAVVNIKHLNISKQHAVITIIDENLHYISDFKSANGTILNNRSLNPLKLYRLNNGASIKFANIFCTYKRLEAGETVVGDVESQRFSDTFYQTNTQVVEIQNSDEIVLNEMATQVEFSDPITINEMPTQIQRFDHFDDSSNDSIDLITMQKATESQAVYHEKNLIVEKAEEETLSVEEDISSLICPVKIGKKMVIDSDSETESKKLNEEDHKESSQIFPVKTGKKLIIDSDSETVCKKLSEDDDVATSQICPVKTGKKMIIDSDSETDCELSEPLSKSRYVISDDSDTDIDKEPKNAQTASTEDLNISGIEPLNQKTSEEIDENDVKVSEPSQVENEEKNNSFLETTDFGMEQNFENNDEVENETKKRNSLEETAFGADQNLENHDGVENEANKSNSLEKTAFDVENVENHDGVENEAKKSNFLEAATSSPSIRFDFDEENADNLYSQPTQKISKDEDQKHEEVCLPNTQTINLLDRNHLSNLYDFDVATQKLDSSICTNEENNILAPPNTFNTLTDVDKDVSQQTQTLSFFDEIGAEKLDDSVSVKEENKQFVKEAPIESVQNLANIEKTDICISPTQALELLHGVDKSNTTEILSTSANSESDFILPTQELQNILANSPKKKKKKMPMHITADHDYTYELPPTQAMEFLHQDNSKFNQVEDQLYEIFATQNESMLGTQQLVDVLETSRVDDVIDDSMVDDVKPSTTRSVKLFNFKKSQLSSVEEVTKILGEDIETEEDNDEKEVKVLRTYARKSDSCSEKQKVEIDEKSSKDNSQNSEIRKSSRQNLIEKNVGGCQQTTGKNEKKKDSQNIQEKASKENRRSKRNLTKKAESNSEEMILIRDNEEASISEKKKAESQEKETENEEKEDSQNRNEKTSKENRKSKRNLTKKAESNSEEMILTADNEEASISEKKKPESQEKKAKNEEKEDSQNSHEKVSKENIRSKRNLTNKNQSNSEEMKLIGDNQEADVSEKNKDVEPKIMTATDKKSRRKQDLSIETRRKNVEELNCEESNSQEKRESQRKSLRNKNLKHDTVKETEEKIIESENEMENTHNTRNKRKTTMIEDEKCKTTESEENIKKETSRTTRRKQNISVDQIRKETEINDAANKTTISTRRKNTTEEDSQKMKETESNKSIEGTSSSRSTRGNTKESQNETEDEEKNEPSNTVAENRSTRASNKRKKDEDQATNLKKPRLKSDSQNSETNSIPKRVATRKRNLETSNVEVKSKVTKNDSSQEETSSASTDESVFSTRMRRLSANSKNVKKELEKSTNKKTPLTRASSSNSHIIPSPDRSRRQQKPKVVFTMMDNPELESWVRQLGGSVVDTVDCCSVLVTEKVKRSQKLLCAVGQGKPICSPEWIQACKKNFEFVDPWDFILLDKEAEKKWDFSLRDSLKRAGKTKLLEKYTFQLIVNNAADVLKGAIESCGGKCVTRNLPKAESEHLIIVSTENNRSKYNKIVKQNPEIKVVEIEAIFDGTLRQEFRFSRHLLS